MIYDWRISNLDFGYKRFFLFIYFVPFIDFLAHCTFAQRVSGDRRCGWDAGTVRAPLTDSSGRIDIGRKKYRRERNAI